MVESLDERVTPAVTATFSAAAGQLKIIGDAQDNTFVVSRDAAGTILVNSGAIPIQGDPGATVANVHSIMMNGVGGNDNLSLDESNGPLPMASIFGGDGNDVLSGGSGMDFVDGGAGNDMVFLGAGDDTFQWNPGDGSDVVEGQGGIDTMVFNGSDLAENFDIAANGSALPFHRVLFTRDVGNIAMDLSGVETIDLNAFGGADTITVNDQSTTEIFSLNLDLSSSGGAGDGQADAVIINGTEGDDFGQIESFGTRISANVSFFPFVRITGAEGANDRLTVNALGGNDEVDATFLSANAIGLVLNGDTGNDELVAGGANDLVIGGPGNDTAFLGAGDDTFVWNPGDGSDVLEGELGNDKLTFNGADTAEDIAIARNGSRVELSRDQGNVLMDINGFEGIDLNALGGADTVTVNNLSGTGVVKVQLNLSGSAASIDGQADNIIINATSDDDDIRLSAAGNTVLVDGVFPVVRITGAEAVNDRLTINGLGGNDSVDDSNFPANLIGLTVLLGQSAVAPQVVSVTPNGNLPSLAGPQRSRVVSLVVTFDQPVLLDANAVTLALHTKNVSFGGAAQPSGIGALPTSLNLVTADQITWTLTFAGNTDDGADGLRSLRDGVYDLVVDATKVHLVSSPRIAMAANSTTTFHRLFGDTGAPTTPSGGTPNVDFLATVNSGDNLAFRGAFNNQATYQAFLDFNGDGTINSGDNLQFRGRFNKALTWTI